MVMEKLEPNLKRIIMDLTREQHRKLRMAAWREDKPMRDMIREFIDSLPEPTIDHAYNSTNSIHD